jgi:hypothetical protein
MAFPNISPALNGVSSVESRWLAQELMVRHRSNQAERTPFSDPERPQAMVSKMKGPAMPVGMWGMTGLPANSLSKGDGGERREI